MSENEYGLDTHYFESKLSGFTDLSRFTPAELSRSLLRLAVTADADVFLEPEFQKNADFDVIYIDEVADVLGISINALHLRRAKKPHYLSGSAIIGGRVCWKREGFMDRAMKALFPV